MSNFFRDQISAFGKKIEAIAKPEDATPVTPPKEPAVRLNLDTATREELVEFVRRQNVHVKKLESKLTGKIYLCLKIYQNFRTDTKN
jgi:hypothetical protein